MWSEQELGKLTELMPVLGRNYGAYQEYLPGRTYNQIKSQCHNTWNKAQDGKHTFVVRDAPKPKESRQSQETALEAEFHRMAAELLQALQAHEEKAEK